MTKSVYSQQGIEIVSPVSGDILNATEACTVKWIADTSIEYIDIKLWDASSSTFRTITENYDASSSSFTFIINESMLSSQSILYVTESGTFSRYGAKSMAYIDIAMPPDPFVNDVSDDTRQELMPILYPNPANNIINFKNLKKEIYIIRIISIEGKEVDKNLYDFYAGDPPFLNVKKLGKGFYILLVKDIDYNSYSFKLIIN